MSADDAIVLSTDPTLGGEAFTPDGAPAADRNRGRFDYGGVFNGMQALLQAAAAPKYTPRTCPLPVESRLHEGSRTRRASRTAA